MATLLNTSATNCILEELIKSTKGRLIPISPFLKANDRMKTVLRCGRPTRYRRRRVLY